MKWQSCRNLLIIRLDNMGDLLMSVPAINALKQTFQSKITVLTSSAAKGIADYIPAIDEVIVYDVPWMKSSTERTSSDACDVIDLLKTKKFDTAVIFTVFSQNPLPAAMLAYMAQIPLRLACCRENPYHLLTDWVPEKEPYEMIRHQVRRDLDLVKHIGATTEDEAISIALPKQAWQSAQAKLMQRGVTLSKPWIVCHPGVSEIKRQFPVDDWVEAIKKMKSALGCQIILTGVEHEKPLTEDIRLRAGSETISVAGTLSLEEFIMVINYAPLVITVNTSTAHISAATKTKVIVLYAMTNPQHTPWKAEGRVLPFSVPDELKSKNEILRFVDKKYFPVATVKISPDEIVDAAQKMFHVPSSELIPENFNFLPIEEKTVDAVQSNFAAKSTAPCI
jgi:ADP-heptose:LPS heptosyltransferase